MYAIYQTEAFNLWFSSLSDRKAQAQILVRIKRASSGNFGDARPVGNGVYEMRIHLGPGYRIYYARERRAVYLLLNGGDKSTQQHDIKAAISLWKQVQKETS